jgi:hypothetical protein
MTGALLELIIGTHKWMTLVFLVDDVGIFAIVSAGYGAKIGQGTFRLPMFRLPINKVVA